MAKVWRYGDNIDTDAIIPARYLNTWDAAELARHCFEDVDQTFAAGVRPGDVVVGGTNFGCGSSREHAPVALKAAGVSFVVAANYARIFFRNSINIGLPLVEAPDAVGSIKAGDDVTFDSAAGVLTNRTTGQSWTVRPFPAFLTEIVAAGGLIPLTRRRLGLEGGTSAGEGGGDAGEGDDR